MKHLAAAMTALILAACGAPEPASAPAADAPGQASMTAASTPPMAQPTMDISGQWNVVEVVASPPDPGTPVIKVSITADRIRAQSQCKHYWWTYQLSGSAFDAATEPYPDALCERTDSYWEQFFVEAIDRANIAAPRPDGSLLLTGPGGQVLLRPAA